MNYIKDIRDFQEKIAETKEGWIKESTNEEEVLKGISLRERLITEEINEMLEAMNTGNEVEILDGAVDSFYVILGTLHELGLLSKFEDAWKLVHENNMSKLGPDGKVKKDSGGKIIKPENFKKLDLSILFN